MLAPRSHSHNHPCPHGRSRSLPALRVQSRLILLGSWSVTSRLVSHCFYASGDARYYRKVDAYQAR